MRQTVALAVLAVTLVLVLAASIRHSEPQMRGFDEINYLSLSVLLLRPGDSVTQAVEVQARDLSRISFLYSYTGQAQEVVRVSVHSTEAMLADRNITLPRSLPDQDPMSWWQGGYVDSLARYQAVPVKGPVRGQVTVTISVAPTAQTLALWWSPAAPAQSHAVVQSSTVQATDMHLTIRTEYGPVRPAIEKAPTFVERMAQYGAPWLPVPALWLLAGVIVAVVGCTVWLLASDSVDDHTTLPSDA